MNHAMMEKAIIPVEKYNAMYVMGFLVDEQPDDLAWSYGYKRHKDDDSKVLWKI